MATKRAELYHGLAVMLRSGLPVLKALELASRTAGGRFRPAFRDMRDAAAGGETLASAMARHPAAFTPLEVLIVEAAETSGHLPESLERLAQYYAFRDRLRGIVLSGLALPLVILHLAALIIPVPELVTGQVGLAGYLARVAVPLLFFYAPAAAILAIVRFTPKTGPLRALLDAFTLQVPLLGRAVRHLAMSRFCRTFQMLYATGSVPISECVRKAAELSGNETVRRRLAGGVATAEAGHPVSDGFSPRLPLEFLATWRIAEESGTLDETASRLADQAAEDAERLLERLATWLPRIVYFLVSLYMIFSIFRMFFRVYGPILRGGDDPFPPGS